MTTKTGLGLIALTLTANLLLATACSKSDSVAGWKAKIETIDGVRTVRNPETPRYGEFAFNLIEDLAIGDEKSEQGLFSGWVTVNVDDEGTIYACDGGIRRVQVFDKNGAFVMTLGRQGQGPGEYTFPTDVHFDDVGDAYVNNGRSFVIFGREGAFKRNLLTKTFLSAMTIGPGGTVVGTTQPNPRAEGGPKNELVQLGPDGERRRTLAQYKAYGASKDQLLVHWYSGRILFCRQSNESLFYGFSLEYEIHVVNGDGRELLRFSKAEKAQGITGEEKDLTREKGIFAWYNVADPKTADLGMPDHRPFFSRFLSDDKGRLYVVRFHPITAKDDPSSDIDVFSRDGIYLYRMKWPFMPHVIKGGFLYEFRQDEDKGLTRIIRHRITNWSDFKVE
jgi:hypothetical protein